MGPEVFCKGVRRLVSTGGVLLERLAQNRVEVPAELFRDGPNRPGGGSRSPKGPLARTFGRRVTDRPPARLGGRTRNEILRDARLESASQRDSLTALARRTEQLRYSAVPPAPPEIEASVAEGSTLLRELGAAPERAA